MMPKFNPALAAGSVRRDEIPQNRGWVKKQCVLFIEPPPPPVAKAMGGPPPQCLPTKFSFSRGPMGRNYTLY